MIRALPAETSLFLGKCLGECVYYLDAKHRRIACANVKAAFQGKLRARQIRGIVKDFYGTLGQNLIEIFLIPEIDRDYINKYITIEGLENIREGFKRGRGVILLGVHAGSWELSSIICANLGFAYSLFVRQQRLPRLNRLLNSYRMQKGCKLIQRQNQLTQFIRLLKANEAVGMSVDQGGRSGALVEFLGRQASMATGAVRMALKYDAALIPVFYNRVKGPYFKIMIQPPVEVKRSGDTEADMLSNLQRVACVFEDFIRKYPKEYLWTYKIWKYSRQRDILILSDGKTGHLRQSQATAAIAADYLKDKGIESRVHTLEIRPKPATGIDALSRIISFKPDVVISCGSSLARMNLELSKVNLARSIAVMRPSFLSTRRFDLVIMPRHDNPPRSKNVAITDGALNLIDDDYLKEQSGLLKQRPELRGSLSGVCVGLLIGGNTKKFALTESAVQDAIRSIKSACERLDADILATTSRRTPAGVEELVKNELGGYPRCKLLIIANEKNIPEAVGGILGLSRFIITSPESISMVSEAVNSGKYVLVLDLPGLSQKHRRFLAYLSARKYIYLVGAGGLAEAVAGLWQARPSAGALQDNLRVREALARIL